MLSILFDFTALRSALRIRRHSFAPTHFVIASSMLNLAQLLMQTNRNMEAQQLLQQAVAIRAREPHYVDAESVAAMEQYAVVLRRNGHASDADAAEARARLMRAEINYVVKAYR